MRNLTHAVMTNNHQHETNSEADSAPRDDGVDDAHFVGQSNRHRDQSDAQKPTTAEQMGRMEGACMFIAALTSWSQRFRFHVLAPLQLPPEGLREAQESIFQHRHL